MLLKGDKTVWKTGMEAGVGLLDNGCDDAVDDVRYDGDCGHHDEGAGCGGCDDAVHSLWILTVVACCCCCYYCYWL